MTSIINIGPSPSFPPVRPGIHKLGTSDGIGATAKPRADALRFSDASYSAPPHVLEEVSLRLAKANAIRAEIEAGTFETKERIQGTVERLIDIIV